MSSGSVAAIDDFNKEADVGETISYTWVIENVDSCFKDTSNSLQSPSFYNKARDGEWQIKSVFPPKSVSNDEGYLGVFLQAVLIPNDAVNVKFAMFVRDSKDQDITENRGENRFTEEDYAWGFDKIIELSELRSEMRDKTLKIHIDIVIKGEVLPTSSCLSETTLYKSLKVLFESSSFTDVVFEVKGRQLKAHKCILSVRSPVFATMFTHDSTEKLSGVVKIVDFDIDIFRRFLHFVYSGRVSIPSVDVATELFRAAEKYDFPDLKLSCVKYMSTNLNSFNFVSVLSLAETFCLDDLKQTVMNYICGDIEY